MSDFRNSMLAVSTQLYISLFSQSFVDFHFFIFFRKCLFIYLFECMGWCRRYASDVRLMSADKTQIDCIGETFRLRFILPLAHTSKVPGSSLSLIFF